ncbi:hypothetical protein STEG23_032180, partial [Scotinomys teguina]
MKCRKKVLVSENQEVPSEVQDWLLSSVNISNSKAFEEFETTQTFYVQVDMQNMLRTVNILPASFVGATWTLLVPVLLRFLSSNTGSCF